MEQQMEFNFESSIQGYHVYKSIWTYEISEKLRCDREEINANDKFAVKLVRNDGNKEQCVGHVPIELSKVFIIFLKEVAKYLQL
jgi:isopropylmalate/homocitrate/citramalate synthase